MKFAILATLPSTRRTLCAMALFFVTMTLAFVAVSCSQSPADTSTDKPAAISHEVALEVMEPRAQVLPNGMGAVYLSIKNPSERSERLVSVESAVVDTAETHESVDDNGIMRMVAHPDGFEIPAGETLVLEPGGKHIMLMGPRVPEGAQAIALTLHFEHADSMEIEAPLRQMGGMDHGGMDHGGMDHGS